MDKYTLQDAKELCVKRTGTWNEYIENKKKQWCGKHVKYGGVEVVVKDVNQHGALIVERLDGRARVLVMDWMVEEVK